MSELKKNSNNLELLEFFVKMANLYHQMELDVTINVSGLCISGKLIGASQFYDGLSEYFNRSKIMNISVQDTINEVKDSYKNIFNKIKNTIPKTAEELEKYDFKFIYLKEARFYSGFRAIPTENPVYWAGRLSSVDGFSLGTLNEAI